MRSVSRTPPRGAVDGRVGVVISRDLNRGEIIDISSYFFCRFHQRPTHTKSQPALAALSKPCSGLISSPMSARAGARAAGAHPLPTQQKNSSSIANFCRWPGAAKCCGGRAPLRISFRPSARKKARSSLKLFSFKRKIYWRFLTHICIKFIRPRPRRAHQGLNQSAQRRCRQIGAVFSQSPAAVGVRVEELHRNRERGTVLLLRGPSRRALGGAR